MRLSPVGYSVLLKAHGRMENRRSVGRVVREIFVGTNAVHVDNVLLNSAADALVRCGEVDVARRLVCSEKFKALVDVRSFNIVMKGVVGRDGVEKGFNVVEVMRGRGLVPNAVTRNTLVDACRVDGDLERAVKVAGGDLGGGLQGQIVRTSLAEGLVGKGRVDEALEMVGSEASDISICAVIGACFRNGRGSEAVRVFERALEKGDVGCGVVKAYVGGLCRTGGIRGVRKAVRVLETVGAVDVECYNVVVEGLVKVGDLDGAETVVKGMRRGGRRGVEGNVVTMTILIKGFGEGGDFAKARGYFGEIFDRGLIVDRVALNAFLSVCCRVGEVESGERILRFMEEKGGGVAPTVFSYTPIMGGFLKEGKMKEAWDVYGRMKGEGIRVNRFVVDMFTNYICRVPADERCEDLAKRGTMLLNDGVSDGVDVIVLRKARRMMLALFLNTPHRVVFHDLRFKHLRSASEDIFHRHGWNKIDSGWRAL